MKAAPNGVEAEQRALEVESATADHGRTREVLLEASGVLVVEGIGPKSGVVGETVGEQLEGLLEKVLPVSSLLFVPHPECDLVEGDPVHVVVAKILDYFSLRPVLGNPCPGGFVPLAQLFNHLEDKGFATGQASLFTRYLDRIDREVSGLGEVKVKIEGSGGIGFQPERAPVGIEPVLQGHGPGRNLGKVPEFAHGRGGVRDDDLASVGNLLEEFILHEIIKAFAPLVPWRESAR